MQVDLTLSDISGVIRLVREVCDRWDDPRSWREHLLRGACVLMDASAGMMIAELGDAREGVFGRLGVVSVVGVPESMRDRVAPFVSRLERRDYRDASENILPGLDHLYGHMVRQGWVTVARQEIADDETYHAAPHYQDFRKHLDCDDYVVSIRVVDLPRRPEAISIDRPHGARRFGPREVAILKLLHDEVAPLIGVRLATEEHLCRSGLSKRLLETLSLLLEGRSEKEVARGLGLSTGTVHDYVTMLYEHFEVCSRAELLAYFVRRQPALRGKRNPGVSARSIVR